MLLFVTLFQGSGSVACVGQLVCDGTSLTLPITLLAVGFVGFLVTGIVGNVVAVRHLGLGATAYLRRRRRPGWPPSGPTALNQSALDQGGPGSGGTPPF